MSTITAEVTSAHVDAAIAEIAAGGKPQFACPVQRALQAHVDRVAIVYQGSWHLGAQDKVLATKGEALPAQAIAFVAAFDEWVEAARRRAVHEHEDLEDAAAATPGRPGTPFQFSVTLPTRSMVEAKEQADAKRRARKG